MPKNIEFTLWQQSPIKGPNERASELEERLQAAEKEKQKLLNILGDMQRENERLASKLNMTQQLKDKEVDEMKRLLDKEVFHILKL